MDIVLKFVMEKPLKSNKGFTLIETIIVLMLYCMLLAITISYIPKKFAFRQVEKILKVVIEEQNAEALLTQKKHEIQINPHSISFDARLIEFPFAISCHPKKVHFTAMGTISNPFIVHCESLGITKEWGYSLGSGVAYEK